MQINYFWDNPSDNGLFWSTLIDLPCLLFISARNHPSTAIGSTHYGSRNKKTISLSDYRFNSIAEYKHFFKHRLEQRYMYMCRPNTFLTEFKKIQLRVNIHPHNNKKKQSFLKKVRQMSWWSMKIGKITDCI